MAKALYLELGRGMLVPAEAVSLPPLIMNSTVQEAPGQGRGDIFSAQVQWILLSFIPCLRKTLLSWDKSFRFRRPHMVGFDQNARFLLVLTLQTHNFYPMECENVTSL